MTDKSDRNKVTDEGWNDYQQAREKLIDFAAKLTLILEDPLDVAALFLDISISVMLPQANGGAPQVAEYLRSIADRVEDAVDKELPRLQ